MTADRPCGKSHVASGRCPGTGVGIAWRLECSLCGDGLRFVDQLGFLPATGLRFDERESGEHDIVAPGLRHELNAKRQAFVLSRGSCANDTGWTAPSGGLVEVIVSNLHPAL